MRRARRPAPAPAPRTAHRAEKRRIRRPEPAARAAPRAEPTSMPRSAHAEPRQTPLARPIGGACGRCPLFGMYNSKDKMPKTGHGRNMPQEGPRRRLRLIAPIAPRGAAHNAAQHKHPWALHDWRMLRCLCYIWCMCVVFFGALVGGVRRAARRSPPRPPTLCQLPTPHHGGHRRSSEVDPAPISSVEIHKQKPP